MKKKRARLPMSEMNLMLRNSLARLRAMTPAEKIQTLVTAGMMTQEEADQAKQRLLERTAANPPAEAGSTNP